MASENDSGHYIPRLYLPDSNGTWKWQRLINDANNNYAGVIKAEESESDITPTAVTTKSLYGDSNDNKILYTKLPNIVTKKDEAKQNNSIQIKSDGSSAYIYLDKNTQKEELLSNPAKTPSLRLIKACGTKAGQKDGSGKVAPGGSANYWFGSYNSGSNAFVGWRAVKFVAPNYGRIENNIDEFLQWDCSWTCNPTSTQTADETLNAHNDSKSNMSEKFFNSPQTVGKHNSYAFTHGGAGGKNTTGISTITFKKPGIYSVSGAFRLHNTKEGYFYGVGLRPISLNYIQKQNNVQKPPLSLNYTWFNNYLDHSFQQHEWTVIGTSAGRSYLYIPQKLLRITQTQINNGQNTYIITAYAPTKDVVWFSDQRNSSRHAWNYLDFTYVGAI